MLFHNSVISDRVHKIVSKNRDDLFWEIGASYYNITFDMLNDNVKNADL